MYIAQKEALPSATIGKGEVGRKNLVLEKKVSPLAVSASLFFEKKKFKLSLVSRLYESEKRIFIPLSISLL